MREYWEEKIGPTYYHFVYKDVLFLMLNSEDYEPERMEKIFLARERSLKIESGEIEGNFEDTEYYKMPERTYGDIGEQQLEYFKKVQMKIKMFDGHFYLCTNRFGKIRIIKNLMH